MYSANHVKETLKELYNIPKDHIPSHANTVINNNTSTNATNPSRNPDDKEEWVMNS